MMEEPIQESRPRIRIPIPTPRQRIVMLVDGEKEPMQVDEWADLKL
jgi:hypothetical protein